MNLQPKGKFETKMMSRRKSEAIQLKTINKSQSAWLSD